MKNTSEHFTALIFFFCLCSPGTGGCCLKIEGNSTSITSRRGEVEDMGGINQIERQAGRQGKAGSGVVCSKAEEISGRWQCWRCSGEKSGFVAQHGMCG